MPLSLSLARSSHCFPLERCSLGICVEQTAQDIMYNGFDYSMKVPGEEGEEQAETETQGKETGTGDEVDLRYPHMLKYPESSAPEDCLFVVKWGGEPGTGQVNFEIRSKRKTGIVGFCRTKETVRCCYRKCSFEAHLRGSQFQVGADATIFSADGRVEDAHINR